MNQHKWIMTYYSEDYFFIYIFKQNVAEAEEEEEEIEESEEEESEDDGEEKVLCTLFFWKCMFMCMIRRLSI